MRFATPKVFNFGAMQLLTFGLGSKKERIFNGKPTSYNGLCYIAKFLVIVRDFPMLTLN